MESPVIQTVNPAVHFQLLTSFPGILNDRCFTHVACLLLHIDLTQAIHPEILLSRLQESPKLSLGFGRQNFPKNGVTLIVAKLLKFPRQLLVIGG